LDLQEGLSPLPGDPGVDHHRHLDVAHQSAAKPLVGSPHAKSNPSQSLSFDTIKYQVNITDQAILTTAFENSLFKKVQGVFQKF
jgi:hypothetical protein